MAFGLSSKVTRPSSSLKKKLMVRLELHRDSMDILKIVLRINETQGKTVQEVIALAEEKDGELFLDTWRFIFELLSLTKDFEKLVDADHWQLTDPIKTLESPLHNQHARDAYHNTCKRSVQENAPYSNKPEEPLSNKLKEPRINNRKVSRLETQKTRSSSENWREWSLPPPSEDSLSQETWKETSMEMGDDKAGERTVSLDGRNLQQFWNDNPPLLSPAPLPAVVPASQLEQSAAPDTSVTEKEEGRSSTWQINSGQGHSSLVRRPSSSLKDKLMVRLELHRDSMDILKIVLRINETQGKTVQEVIALAEEKDGELFLDTWRFIFELLSLTKDFEKLVNADHWPLRNAIKTLENALQDQHARDANYNTCKRSPQENAPCRVSRLEAQKTKSSFKNGPERSLPPPPEDNLSRETWKETTFMETRDDDTEHQNLVVDEAGERTVSSDGQNLQQFWGGDTDESIDKEDHSGSACQIDTIPSLYSVDSRTSSTGTRPVTPEGASNPVGRLTGHHLQLNQEASQENDLVGETCPSVTDDATENSDHFQQSPRERSLELEAYQLELQRFEQQCAQQQGTINELQRILYDSIFLEAENQRLIRMTQELNEMKDQEIEQLTQLCGQKDQDYERMAELCDQKDQDNERLAEEIERLRGEHRQETDRLRGEHVQETDRLRGEHVQDIDRLKGEHRQETDRLRGEFVQRIHQMDQRSKCSQTQIENLRRENQELSEELQQIGAEVRESHERKLELEAELECMRRDDETLLDQRMTELEQAFINAESDEVKVMKQELAKEKRKRREAGETIEGLFKAMMNELMESSGSVACADGMQEDPGSSSTESTVVEADEESDDGEEVFQDALDHLRLV